MKKALKRKSSNEHTLSYAEREYGVTRDELDRFVRRMDKRIACDGVLEK